MAPKELFEDPIFRESIDAYKEAASDTLTYTTGFKPGKPGTYAICLDNRNSRFSSKSVQVSIDRQEVLFNIALPLHLKLFLTITAGCSAEYFARHSSDNHSRL